MKQHEYEQHEYEQHEQHEQYEQHDCEQYEQHEYEQHEQHDCSIVLAKHTAKIHVKGAGYRKLIKYMSFCCAVYFSLLSI